MSIKLYACGGAGTNIAKKIKDLNIDTVYVDTSDSNLKGIDPADIFIAEGMDGAGKYRMDTFETFKEISGDVLIQHQPSRTLNVVLSSLSGGSGSVIAPLVVKELLSQGHPVLVIGVESRNSVIEQENTVKTLKSYKGIADTTRKSVSMFFVEGGNRVDADKTVVHFINLLMIMTDRSNTDEFDTADLKNFLSFEKVTSSPPTVGFIELNQNEDFMVDKGTAVAATILLTSNRDSTLNGATPQYATNCVVLDTEYPHPDIRIDNMVGRLSTVVGVLEATVKSQRDAHYVARVKELDVSSSAHSTGMVI